MQAWETPEPVEQQATALHESLKIVFPFAKDAMQFAVPARRLAPTKMQRHLAVARLETLIAQRARFHATTLASQRES